MVRRRAERDGLVRDEQPEEPQPEKKAPRKKACRQEEGRGGTAPDEDARPRPRRLSRLPSR